MKNRIRENVYNRLINGGSENFRSLLDIIHEVNEIEGGLEAYEVWDNDEDFFEEFYTDSPYELMEAIVDGKYDRYAEYVRIESEYQTLESWEESDLKEYYAEHFSEIFDKIAECYKNDDIEAMPVEIADMLDELN